MKQYYIVCDVSLCHDCNNCFMACKDEHVDNDWLPFSHAQPRHEHRWVNILRTERGQQPRIDVAYLPFMCRHCAAPECVKAFPDLITKREDGPVLIDTDKAQGASQLIDACPYGAMYWHEDVQIAQKCTMCTHLLDDTQITSGMSAMPRCVHSCPTNALEFHHITPAEMAQKINADRLESYQPELGGTGAQVYYKNLYRFEKLFIAGGLLLDGECAEGIEVSLSKVNDSERLSASLITQITDYFGDFKFDALEPGTYSLAANGKALVTINITESVNVGTLVLA
ncbi:MAG: (4Fe-4S)-binding protein [Oscillospiraceae bacterium]|nr:(4Fe-4S)-binding protein [Oscillospiraceae bacterium]